MKNFEKYLMAFISVTALIGFIYSILTKNYTAAMWQFVALCWVGIAFIKQLTIDKYENDI